MSTTFCQRVTFPVRSSECGLVIEHCRVDGEDSLITCPTCNYAANVETAVGIPPSPDDSVGYQQSSQLSEWLHNNLSSHGLGLGKASFEVVPFALDVPDNGTSLGLVVLQRGLKVNEVKLRKALSQDIIMLTDQQDIQSLCQNSSVPVTVMLDITVPKEFSDTLQEITRQVLQGRCRSILQGDYHSTSEGHDCLHCAEQGHSSKLQHSRGIEIAHTFLLGDRYSRPLDATFKGEHRKGVAMMGCYGVGVSRLLAAVVEAHHDHQGIRWPHALAPYHVCIIPVDKGDGSMTSSSGVDKLVAALQERNTPDEVLVDDRPGLSFGRKIKDASLIGYPVTIIVGRSYIENGRFEVEWRQTGNKAFLTLEELIPALLELQDPHQTLAGATTQDR